MKNAFKNKKRLRSITQLACYIFIYNYTFQPLRYTCGLTIYHNKNKWKNNHEGYIQFTTNEKMASYRPRVILLSRQKFDAPAAADFCYFPLKHSGKHLEQNLLFKPC